MTTQDIYKLTKSSFQSMSKQFSNINGQLIELSCQVKLLKKNCKCSSALDKDMSFEEEAEEGSERGGEGEKEDFSLHFPLENDEDFEKFNTKISNNHKFRHDLVTRLSYLVSNKKNISKNIGSILRVYLTRDVVLLYVAIKNTTNNNKKIFKDTPFFLCITEVIRRILRSNSNTPLDDNEIQGGLSSAKNNARDWNGHRLMRLEESNKKKSIYKDVQLT